MCMFLNFLVMKMFKNYNDIRFLNNLITNTCIVLAFSWKMYTLINTIEHVLKRYVTKLQAFSIP